MIIRKLKEEEIPLLYEIEIKTFKKSAWSQESFKYEYHNKHSYQFVVEYKNNIIGYAIIWIFEDESHLVNFAIKKEFRKKGFGEKLLKFVIDFSIKKGVNYIYLEVREKNIPAVSLYKKFNFIIVHKRKKYYNNNEDALIMVKKLKDKE